MIVETMTCEERLMCAIHHQVPDRTPVVPYTDFFPATYARVSMKEYLFQPKAGMEAVIKTFDDMGGWDCMFPAMPPAPLTRIFTMPMQIRLPGIDLPESSPFQFIEKPLMTLEEYDVVMEKGWDAFCLEDLLPRIHPNISAEQVVQAVDDASRRIGQAIEYWNGRGIPTLIGGQLTTPFGLLGMARSIQNFAMDLYRHAEKVISTCEALLPGLIEKAEKGVERTGIKRIFIPLARCDNTFLSPKQFERFVMPILSEAVNRFARKGIVSVLHCDQDWGKNLPIMARLPKDTCILQLDGFTNIQRAKEVVGDCMCLMGDVPATMLAMGTPEQVEDYVTNLIKTVGKDGGFILCSGCDIPVDAKPANVKKMIEIGKSTTALIDISQ